MPPEPLPWDRKDFFREKKHTAGGYDRVSEPLGGSVARWRDTPSHGSRNEYGRWNLPSDFRRPPGHGKQGSWHNNVYPDDMPHGYGPTRSGDRFFQDGGGFRPSGPYRDGRYNRNFRENRPSFSQREWRGHSWDYNHHHGGPSSGPGRIYDGKDQKSVDGAPARWSRPQLDVANTPNLVRSEEQRDESCDVSKADTGQRVEKEEPLASDWKPFKWSRPGSLNSRGSGFSLSSSSKGEGESCDVKIDTPLKIATPDESSSGDAVGCLASPTSMDDTTSRKKPRLGWGEGLAKYEKKKVEGPDDCQTKGSSSAQCTSNIEPMHSPLQNWADQSPRFGGFFECRSPTTPSSVAYSSSPGLDDKSYMKVAEIDSDANKLCPSPTPMPQNHIEGVSLNLEDMDIESFCKLNGLLTELLQKENQRSLDSGLTKTALNKLLLWKGDISKVLELTESEIDSLENELKSLKSQPGSNNPGPKSLSSVSMECKEFFCAESNIRRSSSLPLVASSSVIVGGMVPYGNVVEEALAEAKDECIDSPGSATSKFKEALSSDKLPSPKQRKHGHSVDMIVLESAKNEACTSPQVQNKARLSGPDSETKAAIDGIVPGPENMAVCDDLEDNAVDDILVSNKVTALKASKLFGNLLPSSHCEVTSIEAISSTCGQNNLLIEKFLKRERSLGFKKRVLSMKYKAFRYMWKEELQFLSDRKYRAKSQKKVEPSLRSLHGGLQKHRSSIRSRFTSPACNSSLFPTKEAVRFTSKLLADPQMRCYRNNMKMPALILDRKEKVLRFLSNNGLVKDPCAVERERPLMNPWTSEEKGVFLDKYAAFGKDFTKISSFLAHKTTADCIEFYYKNHKSDCFKKVKKQQELKKQQTSAPTTRYLMTSEKKWSKEMNAASLDMLGAASAIVAHDDEGINKSAKILSISGSDRKLKRNDGLLETLNSYDIEDERETEAADVLAGICGSLSSEAMSSCITSSADPGEATQDWKSRKTSSEPSGTRCPPTAEDTQNVDDDTCSDESCGYVEPVDWTDEEKSSFVQAFSSYGKDFVMISRCVRTKSRDQCKVFFSKARKCLGLEMLYSRPGDEEMQTGDDLDGGRSDTEDACVVENDFTTCVDKMSVETDEKTPLPSSNINHDDIDNAMNLHDIVDHSGVSAPVRLDGNDLKGNTQNQDCQQDTPDLPDDGTVLNEEVENTVILQQYCGGQPINGHDTVMSEPVTTDSAKTGTALSNQLCSVVAETANEKPEAGLRCGSIDNQAVCVAPFSIECVRDELLKRSASANDLRQLQHGQTSPDNFESCPTQRKMSRVAGHMQPSTPCISDASVQPLQVYLKKCQRSASLQPVGELPLLSKSHSQMCRSVPDHQQHLFPDTSEKPSKNVKIFGQILSKPVTTDKRASDSQVSSRCEGGSLDMLPINKETAKYALSNGSLGLENVPVRSSGIWEGNRIIPTSCPSIPDSALLVARYPAVFGNPSLTTSMLEQQLPNKCSSASVASSSSNGTQPYISELKEQEALPRNGFEAVPGLQQIELNVLHGDGRAAGSSCNGLTDPVAALKLLYAKTQKHGGGSSGKDEESWRSQHGDVGR